MTAFTASANTSICFSPPVHRGSSPQNPTTTSPFQPEQHAPPLVPSLERSVWWPVQTWCPQSHAAEIPPLPKQRLRNRLTADTRMERSIPSRLYRLINGAPSPNGITSPNGIIGDDENPDLRSSSTKIEAS